MRLLIFPRLAVGSWRAAVKTASSGLLSCQWVFKQFARLLQQHLSHGMGGGEPGSSLPVPDGHRIGSDRSPVRSVAQLHSHLVVNHFHFVKRAKWPAAEIVHFLWL